MKPLPIKTQTSPLTAKHPLYPRWRTMINRCFNPNDVNYGRYGARGISVCDRWLSFPNFVDDMVAVPAVNAQLDRIDNNGEYSPQNCRWATPQENCRNRRDNVVIELYGISLTVAEWAERLGIRGRTLRQRLTYMGAERAILRPIRNARGEECGSTVLTPDQVRDIRQSNESLRVLSSRYGLSISAMHSAKSGLTWKHIK